MRILTVKDIIELYGLEKNFVYELLNRRGCPLLSGKNGRKYRVSKDKFEEWLLK